MHLRGQIAGGETSTVGRPQDPEEPTVAKLGQRYLDDYATAYRKPSGVAQDHRNLQNHVAPLIGSHLVNRVEWADVARMMPDTTVGKTAKDDKTKHQGRRIVRGREIVANQDQALLSKMSRWRKLKATA